MFTVLNITSSNIFYDNSIFFWGLHSNLETMKAMIEIINKFFIASGTAIKLNAKCNAKYK